MKMRHFYHCAVLSPRWRSIAAGHAEAMVAAGLDIPVTVGLIGPRERRDAAMRWFEDNMPGVDSFEERDEGWEHVTLNQVHEWARSTPGGLVLYCHTKGTHTVTELNDAWRRCMTRLVVGRWRECAGLLRNFSYDLVGTHWMDPGGTPLDPEIPYFCGNFWWAKTDYLAGLPALGNPHNRFEAELWIGRGAPFAYDLDPGGANEAHCMQWTVK